MGAGNFQEYNKQRKQMRKKQHNLVTCTPVMAGVKLATAEPDTPFLKSDGHSIVNRTPIMRRFQVNNGAAAGAA